MEEQTTLVTSIKDSLFCIDFDGTYTLSNLQVLILETLGLGRIPLTELPQMFDTIQELWRLHKAACFDAIRANIQLNEKTEGDWANWNRKIASDGFYQVIVSFNMFGEHVYPWFFQEMLGLSAEFVRENIGVVSFWPEEGIKANKNLHLERATELAIKNLKVDSTIKKSRIVFADDNWVHCRDANAAGYFRTVSVTPKGNHIEALTEKAEWLKKNSAELVEKESQIFFNSSGSDQSPRSALSTSMEKLFRGTSSGTPYNSPPMSDRERREKSPLRRSPFSGTTSPLSCSREGIDNAELTNSRESPGVN